MEGEELCTLIKSCGLAGGMEAWWADWVWREEGVNEGWNGLIAGRDVICIRNCVHLTCSLQPSLSNPSLPLSLPLFPL